MEYKKRHLHNKIREHLDRKEYTIISGARQVGKTTLLRQIYLELKNENREVYYLTLENIDVLSEIDKHPENIFKFTARPANALEKKAEASERVFILIDEIQYVSEPTRFLKYLYDTYLENLKIIATGSSAFYMDEKFNDSLAGRKTIFRLKPLNFSEFLGFRERKDLAEELDELINRAEYKSLKIRELYEYLESYLIFGGYPAVALENDVTFKKEKLLELRDAYVMRDILESGIKNETEFFNLMTLLASQVGGLVNKNEISNTLGIHNKTLNNYLHILQKCFHIDLIRSLHSNIRKEITKMPKVFFQDMGLRNALLRNFNPLTDREDKGALVENYVFSRLRQKYDVEEVKFWRTVNGHEVDFVITHDYVSGQGYEVKYSYRNIKTSSLCRFQSIYPGIKLTVLTYESHPKSLSLLKM